MLWFVLGVAVSLLAAVGWRVLDPGDRQATLPDPAVRGDREAGRAATTLVARLQSGLRAGGDAGLDEVSYDDEARRSLSAAADNLSRLGVSGLGLRYLSPSAEAVPSRVADRLPAGSDPWVADVQVQWRLSPVDRAASVVEMPLVVAWRGTRLAVAGVGEPTDGRVPSWWGLPGVVRRSADVVVFAPDGRRADRLRSQAEQALRVVRRAVPQWTGAVVVEAPATPADFAAASGVSRSDASVLAAVTTTTDGSGGERSPVRIFVNPEVFGPLGPRGQQVVVTHEAAHVALDAPLSRAPLWLAEGVADYIALRGSAVSLETLSAQIRAVVRRDGVPDHLPGAAEFDGANPDIGAWYEASWLAARQVALAAGPRAPMRLYEALSDGGPSQAAYRQVLGSSEAELLRRWQASLRRLAS